MSTNKSDFFTFGNDLFNNDNNEPATVAAAENMSGADLQTCAVCGAKTSTPVCSECGFDNSRNYEQNATLQIIEPHTPPVSLFKALWNPPAEPSVEQTIALIKNQKWDKHVLTAVEDILKRAADGNFDEQHTQTKEETVSEEKEDSHSSSHSNQSTVCSVCGSVNDSQSLYCFKCGVKLRPYYPKKTTSKKSTGKYKLLSSRYCSQCGCKNKSESIHCAFCGAKID